MPSRCAIDRSQPSDTIVVVHATSPASSWLGEPYYSHVVTKIHDKAERVLDELRPIAEQVETPIEFEVLEGPARGGPHPSGGRARRRRDRRRLPRARPAPRRDRQRVPGATPRGRPDRSSSSVATRPPYSGACPRELEDWRRATARRPRQDPRPRQSGASANDRIVLRPSRAHSPATSPCATGVTTTRLESAVSA